MLPSPQHKKSPISMRASLGHPALILIWSTSLLLIGCGVGRLHWIHASALLLCCAGGVLMVVHDAVTAVLFFWLTANWVRSLNIQRDNRR